MQVAAGIEAILAPNPSLMTGAGTTSYVVYGAGVARGCVVIDPGPDDEEHLSELADAGFACGGVRTILVTHGHPDHDAGAARLRELTGAPVLAWTLDGVESADAMLADGAAVDAGGRRLVALYTPGHRFDHLCFLAPESGVLFAGDLVAGAGTVVIAPPEGDLTDYMASLRRLRALDLRLILPAHGPAIDKPWEVLEGYIRHREEREAQALAGLAAGDRTVDALVARIYAEVDPALHPVAALSVAAHLQKLEREGRVIRDAGAAGANGVEIWRPS